MNVAQIMLSFLINQIKSTWVNYICVSVGLATCGDGFTFNFQMALTIKFSCKCQILEIVLFSLDNGNQKRILLGILRQKCFV